MHNFIAYIVFAVLLVLAVTVAIFTSSPAMTVLVMVCVALGGMGVCFLWIVCVSSIQTLFKVFGPVNMCIDRILF